MDEVLIETTKSFDKDLKKLSEKEQNIIAEKLNFLITSIREKGNTKQLYRLQKLKLPKDLSSSLFIFKIDVKMRAILTFEKDPLFNQSIITLLRVVNLDDLDKTFKSVSESLYQDMVNFNNA